MIGTRLAHYAVTRHLGSGAMGEVYQADDLKLGRSVAIKLLPEAFLHDPERTARFGREARALAALNHPHIAAIHGLEEVTGRMFLVMELVQGETLAERIARGAVPLAEALRIATQITEALEAAHGKGILHRDLKPANVKLTDENEVKVLDFGLAKMGMAAGIEASSVPTITTSSSPGAVLGTPGYMSPEQARGTDADYSSDVWAFGCVFFEMLSGRAAFHRQTVADTLADVLTAEPEWSRLPADTPDAIRRLLRRCLQKDRRRRLHHIADARIEIEETSVTPLVDTPPIDRRSRRRERVVWIALLSLSVAIGAVAIGRGVRPVTPSPEVHLEIVTPPTRSPVSLAISPDGRRLVFEATGEDGSRLWLRRLDSAMARPLAGTENGSLPFWDPDSRSLGFFADSKLKRIDVDTGSVELLGTATLSPLGGTWSRDGTILFTPNLQGGVLRVPAVGGPATLVGPGGAPHMLPDGRRFLELVVSDLQRYGVYVSDIGGSKSKRVLLSNSPAWLTSSGHMLFVRDGALYAQSFDAQQLELTGKPAMVAERVELSPDALLGAVSTSTTGSIVYRSASTRIFDRQLIWFNRSGVELGRVGDGSGGGSSLSPDGRLAALSRTVDGNRDVWLLDTSTGVLSRFTSDPSGDQSPLWSPDGRRVVFSSIRKGAVDLYVKPVAAGGSEELLLATPANKTATDWTLDGRYLLYRSNDRQTGHDIWALSMRGDRTSFPVVRTEFAERDGQFSPDARWIAYESNRSGRSEIYVHPFPGPGREQQVSTGGGAQVRWRSDGRELFYIALDGRLTSVPVKSTADTIDTGAPVSLFQTRVGDVIQTTLTQQYVVSANGQRFLVSTVSQAPTSSISVILNWRPPAD